MLKVQLGHVETYRISPPFLVRNGIVTAAALPHAHFITQLLLKCLIMEKAFWVKLHLDVEHGALGAASSLLINAVFINV